jgi:hypothetical protein
MQALNSSSELSARSVNGVLESPGDLPPAPLSYNEYIERKLRNSIREAYARGFDRGCRHQVVVLFVGMMFGCLLGFYVAVTNQ